MHIMRNPAYAVHYACQAGCRRVQAENCALELEGTDSPYTDTAALGDKMQALTQLLPGVDICALVLKDRLVLTADISEAAHRLIVFDNLLGGPDLAELISRTPVLLYADVRLPLACLFLYCCCPLCTMRPCVW